MGSLLKNSDYVHDLLLKRKVITQSQSEEAKQMVLDNSGSFNVIAAIKKLRFADEDIILHALASEFGFEVKNLLQIPSIPQSVIDQISTKIARDYGVLPISFENEQITIAVADPTDIDALDAIRFILKKDMHIVIAPQEQINKLLEHYYGSVSENVESFLKNIDDPEAIESELIKEVDSDGDDSEAPIIKLVSMLIMEAFKRKASDIHFEPLEKKFRIRYRIDGVLCEVEGPPKYIQATVLSRLKIMAKLDIAEKRVPQDGRIQIKVQNKAIDLRVSSIPTTHGESIVMRLLDKENVKMDISTLGFFPDDAELVNKIINMPDGIFLVTGPTGSGKTTSLYAFLNSVNKPSRKIITIEDPIEYNLEGVNQVQVNNLIGMTFASGLRAMMRQSPNIIMVGEIRDMETAEIATNAALTGHLVLSTLHTNDAPSAVTRLNDIGLKPYMIASAVKAIMAQRLVRRICPNCSADYTPTQEEIDIMNLSSDSLKGAKFKKGVGCEDCSRTGFSGRVGLIELFMLKEDMQELIYKRVSSYTIKEMARKNGMRTLREDGIRKVIAGITTLDEVITATVSD